VDYPILTDYRSMFAGLFQRMYGLEAASVQRIFAGIHPAEIGFGMVEVLLTRA